jgi:hypothetical protein
MHLPIFRYPGSDTSTASHTLLQRANPILRESEANGGRRLTAGELQHLHEPIQELNARLKEALMHVDEIGVNEGNKDDHVLLGYEAAAKAAEPLEDGNDRLADFAPSRQHASLEKNTDALAFLEEHVIAPNALKSSAAILKVLDLLSEKIAPLPDVALAGEVVRQKRVFDDAQTARTNAREAYQTVRVSRNSTQNQKDTARAKSNETQDTLIEAERSYTALIAKPELGEDRAAEILADYPIATTKDSLVDVVEKRKNVLRERSLPFFFDGVFVNQLKKQRIGRSARETELTERLRESGLSPSEVKEAVEEWKTHAIHRPHWDNLQEHVAETAQQVVRDVNENIDFRTTQLADFTEELQNNLLAELRQSLITEGDRIIKDGRTNTQYLVEDGRANTRHLIEDGRTNAQNLIEDGRANTQRLVNLTEEQNGILVQALHTEVDRAIRAGEHGLNNFLTLTRQDQRKLLADIHQRLDRDLAQNRAMQVRMRTMSFNDDPNESFANQARRFAGDALRNSITATIRDRTANRIMRNAIQTVPRSLPQRSSYTQRAIDNVALNETTRAIEYVGRRLLEQ